MIVIKGLYYSYIITSQFYLTAKSIINGINAFNKLYTIIEPNIIVGLAVELVDIIIIAKCYTGSTVFFYISNYY